VFEGIIREGEIPHGRGQKISFIDKKPNPSERPDRNDDLFFHPTERKLRRGMQESDLGANSFIE
jgi:hypothetical protein